MPSTSSEGSPMQPLTAAFVLLSMTLNVRAESILPVSKATTKTERKDPYKKKLSEAEIERVRELLVHLGDPFPKTHLDSYEALQEIGPPVLPVLNRLLYAGNSLRTFHVHKLYHE